MSEETGFGETSQSDIALIMVSRAIFDLLTAFGVPLAAVTRVLDLQQAELHQMQYTTAEGILGVIRQLVAFPTRQRQREEIQRLIAEQPKGSA
jgi:hypothetical protein